MSHARQQIREAVAAAVTGLATTGTNVFVNKITPQEAESLPNHGPHSLRRTLVRLAYEKNLTARQWKAWSQNLGHASAMTTFDSYGTLSPAEQADVMSDLGEPSDNADDNDLAREIADLLRKRRTG